MRLTPSTALPFTPTSCSSMLLCTVCKFFIFISAVVACHNYIHKRATACQSCAPFVQLCTEGRSAVLNGQADTFESQAVNLCGQARTTPHNLPTNTADMPKASSCPQCSQFASLCSAGEAAYKAGIPADSAFVATASQACQAVVSTAALPRANAHSRLQ